MDDDFEPEDDAMERRRGWYRYLDQLLADIDTQKGDDETRERVARRYAIARDKILATRPAPGRGASAHRLDDWECSFLDRLEGN
jgi:hypothetical protein